MDAQWPQGIGIIKSSAMDSSNTRLDQRRLARPQKDQALNCPRCNSTNTKFCYYNNYSLSQPRYFCKSCRRYWTEGGSLRNVPVGGGSRKNKRSSLASSPSTANISSNPSNTSKKDASGQINPQMAPPQPGFLGQGQDLNLAYPPPIQDHQDYDKYLTKFIEVPFIYGTSDSNNKTHDNNNVQYRSSGSSSSSSMDHDLLKSGISNKGLISSFVPMPVIDANSTYTSGFHQWQELRPTLNFSLDGLEVGGYVSGLHGSTGTERMLFPMDGYQELKPNNNGYLEQSRGRQGDSSGGYWSGMLGNGGAM